MIYYGHMELYLIKIAKELKRRNWSYSELARRTKVSRQSLSFSLKSKPPIFKILSKISKVLDLDEKDLLR